MAHPFRPGSPLCTGCFWEFEIADFRDIDYIEVWSETFPSVRPQNARAFRFWSERLNEGFRIAATSGRDWHRQEKTEVPVSVTYLGIDGASPGNMAEKAVRAIAAGRASVTMRPLLLCGVECYGRTYSIGDEVPAGPPAERVTVRITVDESVRRGLWALSGDGLKVKITGNEGTLAEIALDDGRRSVAVEVSRGRLRWLRAELAGTIQGMRTMIAFYQSGVFRLTAH